MILSDFLRLFKQGKVSAYSHMKNLLEMAMVDGHFDDSENVFLTKLAKKHRVSAKVLTAIKENKLEVVFQVPPGADEKFEQLYELVHMMVIDDRIDDEEVKLCNIFAKKFGYNETRSHELVESMASNIKNGQSMQETKKRVNWLLN